MFKNKQVMIMWLSVFSLKLMGQSVVTGKVTSVDEGTSIPGVSVLIKGTTKGVVTNSDGNYSIDASAEDILIFSFLGYKSQERAVRSTSVIDIQLETDVSELNEVVVVGYGTQRKSDVTGSVGSVDVQDIAKLPTGSVSQAIQGRIAGVNVQNTNGAGGISIRIRGINSINGGNNPLIVVDGFQGGSIGNLDQIESIEVLKDASATAIYGSRGSNGVILITTKKGKKGKPSITYNVFFRQDKVRKKLDLLNGRQYAELQKDIFDARSLPVPAEVTDFLAGNGTGIDWQDEIFQNAFSHNHVLSVSGGTDNISYFVSLNATDHEGIVKNTPSNGFSLRSNIEAKLTDKLKVSVYTFLSRGESHPTAINGFAGFNDGSPIFSAMLWAPIKSVFDADGNYTQPGGGFGPVTNFNPVALALEPVRDNFTHSISLNTAAEYEIIEGLKVRISGAYKVFDRQNNTFFNSKPTSGSTLNSASVNDGRSETIQNTNQITYETTINEDHRLSVTGVFEQQYQESTGSNSSAQDFLSTSLSYYNLGTGASGPRPSSSFSTRSLLSYMGRVHYGFKDRYLLTLTSRADASSVFGANDKWGFFPSAAFGWNIINESFMDGSNTISNFKFRSSYGLSGNQAIGPFNSLSTLRDNLTYPIDGVNLSTGIGLGRVPNPNLKWETTEQLNVGIDLELYDGRLELTADYYVKKTKDLLLNRPLPQHGGGDASITDNVGDVQNKGIEIYLGGKPVVGDLTWETGITFSKNENKVINLIDTLTQIPLGGAGLPGLDNAIVLEVGKPLGLIQGLEYAGVWSSSESAAAGELTSSDNPFFPGAPKFVDQLTVDTNGDGIPDEADGVINDEDFVVIGSAQPDFTFGWNNTFNYKNFDLNIFIQGVVGNDVYNIGRIRTESIGNNIATNASLLNRWTPQNENTDVPSIAGADMFGTSTSSRYVEDGSYIRFRNISLGYALPASIAEKLNISSARISITGTNLITFTDYTGFEPEASTGVDTRGGIDLATYPSLKSYAIGLNIKF